MGKCISDHFRGVPSCTLLFISILSSPTVFSSNLSFLCSSLFWSSFLLPCSSVVFLSLLRYVSLPSNPLVYILFSFHCGSVCVLYDSMTLLPFWKAAVLAFFCYLACHVPANAQYDADPFHPTHVCSSMASYGCCADNRDVVCRRDIKRARRMYEAMYSQRIFAPSGRVFDGNGPPWLVVRYRSLASVPLSVYFLCVYTTCV